MKGWIFARSSRNLVMKFEKAILSIKYILWLQEEKTKRKISNPAGLLNFALTTNNVKLELTHKHIVDYVEGEKNKSKVSKVDKEKKLKESYDKYIQSEIKKFKKDNTGEYEIVYENLIAVLNNDLDKKIAEYNLLLCDESLSSKDKTSLESQKKRVDRF